MLLEMTLRIHFSVFLGNRISKIHLQYLGSCVQMLIISNDILIGLPGHPCKLQSLNSVACPTQSIPPLRAVCCKIRVRFWDPPSHGLLHSVHSVYGPHLQFPKNDHKLLFYIRFGKSLL